jgi:tetratricopeptide (TPR) repeat protein/predicted Ser/Thr protein kinase
VTPAEWSAVKEILGEALECPPAERSAYLERACGGNEDLRHRVEALVEADGKTWGLLESPAVASSSLASALRPPAAGERIGAYEIVREIGHGGMGIVYLARRADHQFERHVAIKVAQSGLAGDALERRFRAERQIVANLDHPNIARLLDGGTTPDGRAYLVMEYVEGQPLTRWCDAHALDIRQRLEIFLEVCAAVQYAHQHLVVHRDLKPANILVTEQGTVKLLDFGIAKLIDPDLSDGAADRTGTLFRLLTPDYASPEQLRGGPISTASDIYALGVVLYELLTGEKPLKVTGSPPAEMLWIVCEKEPVRPSAVAKPGQSKELTGDLDTIVLTALRKEPARRFASANALAKDIRRYLSGLPVEARTDTFGYRAGKFVRRHRTGVASAALVVAALAAGLVMTLREARRARAAEVRAERRFNDVRKLANGFLFEFHDAIENLPGATPARELVVKRAAEYLDSLSKEAGQDVNLQRELAVAYKRLGEIQGGGGGANLGNSAAALESYEKALSIRRALAARTPPDRGDLEGLAELEFLLGSFFIKTGELDRAEASLHSAVKRVEELIASEKGPADRRAKLAAAYHWLGTTQARRGDESAALTSLQRAMSYGEAFCAAHPEVAAARANLAYVHTDLADRFGRAGQPRAALENCLKARGLQEALIRSDPNNARYPRDLVATLRSEGEYLFALNQRKEALATYSRALDLAQAQLTADPRNEWNQLAVAVVSRSFGEALLGSGQPAAGIERLQQAARVAEKTVGDDPASAFARNELTAIQFALGRALKEHGPAGSSAAEGCRILENGMASWKRLQQEGKAAGEYDDASRRAAAELARCPGDGS